MERELKFRMWTGKNMLYDHKNVIECIRQQNFHNDGIKLAPEIGVWPYDHIGDGSAFMQYSGIKDTNEREVYEGDIYTEEIEHDEGDDRHTVVCTWIKEYATFAMLGVDEYKEYLDQGITDFDRTMRYSYMMDDAEFTRMVYRGTIYENPELLNI